MLSPLRGYRNPSSYFHFDVLVRRALTPALAVLAIAVSSLGLRAETVTVDPEKCVIVIPDDLETQHASFRRRIRLASEELQKHLGLITGKSPEITKIGRGDIGGYPFYVQTRLPEDSGELRTGEARWRVTRKAAFLFANNDGNENGTPNAVYDFLERQLGVRWIEPGDVGISYRKQTPITLTVGEHSWAPTIMYRRIRQGIRNIAQPETYESEAEKERVEAHNRRVAETVRWQARMRMGGSSPGGGHTFHGWWDKYGETHPEYFALTEKGQRAPLRLKRRSWEESRSWVKTCPSNPAVASQIVAEWLPRKPLVRYLSVGVNDGVEGFCRCPKCKALDVRQEGEKFAEHLTDRYMHLANMVASKARAHRPDAMVAVYAYMKTVQPPRRVKLEPNVIVHLVPYVIPLDRQVTEELFIGWKEAGAKHFALRPNYHHKYHKIPIPMGLEEQMFDIFQLAHRFGILSANYDSLMNHWPVNGLADYVLAKSMSEPDQPFEYWEDHYCHGYGAASAEVKEYFRYWRTEVWQKRLLPNMDKLVTRGRHGDFGRGLMWSLKYYNHEIYRPKGCDHYYEASDFDITDEVLDRALARELTESDKAKVNQLVLANRHARLLFKALSTQGMAKYPHSKALHTFRKEHEDNLRLQWGNIAWFERKYMGDATGLALTEMLSDYPLPYRETPFQWHFKIDPEDVGLDEKWHELNWKTTRSEWTPIRINVPWSNTYECQGKKLELKARLKTYDGIGWYSTSVTVPKEMRGRNVYLYFPLVDESCWIYVNGKLAGKRVCEKPEDAATPVVVQIDPHVDWNEDLQTVAVRVKDTGGPGGIRKRVWVVSRER